MSDIQLQVDLTNIVLAVIAIVALWAAWRQVKTMQDDSKTQIATAIQQELATRASVLLSLDERFGDQAMRDARAEMSALIDRVNDRADQAWKSLAVRERRKKAKDYYPEELENLRRANPPDAYSRLMTACGFFETVGYVTYSKYVPIKDILQLFAPAIEDAGIVFEAHIRKLREDYQSEAMYNNFLWLIEESKKGSTGGN